MGIWGGKILWDLTGGWGRVLTTLYMTLLAQMGLGVSRAIAWGMSVLGIPAPHKGRVSPHRLERERFEGEVRNQFLKLKEKGLGIRVFTL